MQNNTKNPNSGQEVSVLDLLFYLLSKWKWFVLSIIVFGGLAWYKYASTPMTYFRRSRPL